MSLPVKNQSAARLAARLLEDDDSADFKRELMSVRNLQVALTKFGFEHTGTQYGADVYELVGRGDGLGRLAWLWTIRLVDYSNYGYATVSVAADRGRAVLTSTASLDIPDRHVIDAIGEMIEYLRVGGLSPNEVLRNVRFGFDPMNFPRS